MSARAYGFGSAQKGRSPPRTMHHLSSSVEASALNVEASALIVEASALHRSNRHSPQRPKRLSLHSSHTQQGQEQHGYEHIARDEPLGYDGNIIDLAFQIGPTKPRSARRSPDENASQPSAVQGGSTKRAKTECRTRIAPSLKRRSLEPPAEGINLTSGKRANLEPQCVKSRPTSLLRVSANNDAHPCSSSSVCSVRVNPMEVAEVQGKGWSSGETATPPMSTPASSITRALQVCVAHLRET